MIATAVQLDSVRNHLTSSFMLTSDIDLTDYLATNYATEGWLPIGSATTPFTGDFDGDGHVITGFWFNRPATGDVGLFGTVSGVSITNLGIRIASQGVVGGQDVGAIVGQITTTIPTTVEKCFVTGSVLTNVKVAGALVGFCPGVATVRQCYAIGNTGATLTTSNGDGVGGMVGGAYTRDCNLLIEECYSADSLTGKISSGGFCGSHSYSTSAVPAAGLITVSIQKCVSVVPYIVGTGTGQRLFGWFKRADCGFFDTNYALDSAVVKGAAVTTGTEFDANGLNKSATELTTQSTYETLGWDFTTNWTMGNGAYKLPILKNFPASVQPTTTVSFLERLMTGIEVRKSESLVVYSNPASDVVSINNKPAAATVYVYNSLGGLILKTQDSVFNLSDVPNGVYFVKVAGVVEKIIKK